MNIDAVTSCETMVAFAAHEAVHSGRRGTP